MSGDYRAMNGIVTFLTDFGHGDGYCGAMRGAALAAARGIRLVDLTHDIPRHDIFGAAFVLRFAARSFPPGTVHCVVVDPGVGTNRRALVVRAGHQVFVGPDNGVLWPASVDSAASAASAASPAGPAGSGGSSSLSGSHGAVALEPSRNERFRPDHDRLRDDAPSGSIDIFELPVPERASRTFHGRDVFAPAAASIAAGILDPDGLERLASMKPLAFPPVCPDGEGRWRAAVLYVDGFGNVVTNIGPVDVPGNLLRDRGFTLNIRGRSVSRLYDAYGEAVADEPFCIWGSAGYLEISVNGGSAADMLGFSAGDRPELVLEIR